MQEYYDNYWEEGGAGGTAPPAHRKWTAQRRAELIKAIASLKGVGLILDAGCGLGEFSDLMAAKGYQVVGIDIAYKPLTSAAKRESKNLVGFAVASVEEHFPFLIKALMLCGLLKLLNIF